MSPAPDNSDEEAPARPLLRVVRGEPDDAELAALIAVVAASSAVGSEAAVGEPDAWRDRSHLVRRQITPGPGAWRVSAWWF